MDLDSRSVVLEKSEYIKSSIVNQTLPNPEHRITSQIIQSNYLHNGELVEWTGEFAESFSSVFVDEKGTKKPFKIGEFPLHTKEKALDLLDSAYKAYGKGRGEWPMLSVSKRIACVEKFVHHMLEARREVINLLMWEIGKSLADSTKEFDRTVQYILDTIHALKDLDRESSRFKVEKNIIGQVRRSPLGVVLCMGPSNYPLNETFTTLIPALIMGNTVVLKTPRPGTMVFSPLIKAFQKSFPKGVINTLYGKGRNIVGSLMETGKVDVLAFIGSSQAANALSKAHPKPNRLRSVLGLEAKNPGILLESANVEMAAAECLDGCLSYNGQRCTALKILFVHRSILDSFLTIFCQKISQTTFGNPWVEGVKITPLPSPDRIAYFQELLDDALAKGATIVNEGGGTVVENFFYPAVVYPVLPSMRLYHEEQFGPIIPILSYTDIEVPLQYIVESNYGQQVSIFGEDCDDIAFLTDTLVNQVSRINLNSQSQRGPDTFPFTGRKDSAEGTLSVHDALRAFSIRSLAALKDNTYNREILTKILNERKSNFLSNDFLL